MIRKLLCALALLGCSVVGAQANPILSLTPALSNVEVNDVFTLDLLITGVLDLFAWQLDLGFDPAGLLNASLPTEGSFLGAGQTFYGGTVDNSAGTITTIASSLSGGSGLSGNGILASISFTAMATGVATVSLGNVTLLDSHLDQIFFDFPTDALNATVNITAINVNNVPDEPSTLALFGLAVGLLLSLRRRAQSRPRRTAEVA